METEISATKSCPLCAEQINVDAIKCKHCGSDLAAACQLCKGPTEKRTPKVTPGGITAVGVILILAGVVGLPFMGLGALGIVLGIVLMVAIKEPGRPILFCAKCKRGWPTK